MSEKIKFQLVDARTRLPVGPADHCQQYSDPHIQHLKVGDLRRRISGKCAIRHYRLAIYANENAYVSREAPLSQWSSLVDFDLDEVLVVEVRENPWNFHYSVPFFDKVQWPHFAMVLVVVLFGVSRLETNTAAAYAVYFISAAGVSYLLLVPRMRSILWMSWRSGLPLGFIRKFSIPVDLESELPRTCVTYREDTVKAFFSHLFPEAARVLFVQSPPGSGKTGMCALLYNHIIRYQPGVLVALVRMEAGRDFEVAFGDQYGCSFRSFLNLKCDRVVLIDDAELAYADEVLWEYSYVKATCEGRRSGLQFVFFSVFDELNLSEGITFGLTWCASWPGLQLSRKKLAETIGNTFGKPACDLVFSMSSGHVGVARQILQCLHFILGRKPRKPADVILELRSVLLLQYLRTNSYIPTMEHLSDPVSDSLSDEIAEHASGILDEVASGKFVSQFDDGGQTPRGRALLLLMQRGLLCAERAAQLRFVSSMHMNVWLFTNRTGPVLGASDISDQDFVGCCVRRMNFQRVQTFATVIMNTPAGQQNQILHELYRATVFCLPAVVPIFQEWRTSDGESVKLLISSEKKLCFWELLVNDEDTADQPAPFQPGGAYESLGESLQYVLSTSVQKTILGCLVL